MNIYYRLLLLILKLCFRIYVFVSHNLFIICIFVYEQQYIKQKWRTKLFYRCLWTWWWKRWERMRKIQRNCLLKPWKRLADPKMFCRRKFWRPRFCFCKFLFVTITMVGILDNSEKFRDECRRKADFWLHLKRNIVHFHMHLCECINIF